MQILDYMETHGHEQLAVWTDTSVGLRAFIAIHSTTLGPALGGTRIWPHPTEDAALMDVLRLSRAMTYKNALAGLSLGGGKGLIIADSRTDKTQALMESYGRFVDTLGGRYITTEDVGASAQDMEWISHTTKHVVGGPPEQGGSGNPSEQTGFGVYQAMRACAEATWGTDSLDGKTVAIQGYGNTATSLAGHLVEAGARLIVTDIDQSKSALAAGLPGVTIVEPDHVVDVDCDIFAPCALGGVLNVETIAGLRCKVVCGSANNQLAEDRDAELLHDRGILYAPDYLVNAGGVINVSYEIGQPYDAGAAKEHAAGIYETMTRVIAMADDRGITTSKAANSLAEDRIEGALGTRG